MTKKKPKKPSETQRKLKEMNDSLLRLWDEFGESEIKLARINEQAAMALTRVCERILKIEGEVPSKSNFADLSKIIATQRNDLNEFNKKMQVLSDRIDDGHCANRNLRDCEFTARIDDLLNRVELLEIHCDSPKANKTNNNSDTMKEGIVSKLDRILDKLK